MNIPAAGSRRTARQHCATCKRTTTWALTFGEVYRNSYGSRCQTVAEACQTCGRQALDSFYDYDALGPIVPYGAPAR
jgi:hypothetical protein